MSLFTSLQLANNALRASQVGLQVAGNNIANANTPGYSRQEAVFKPAASQKLGSLILGLGVRVDSIVQKTDAFLEERLRGAVSDLANGETQEKTFQQLESLIGELNDTDLSTSLTDFFGSIQNILNQPEDVGVRNLAVLQGKTLSEDISRLASRVREVRSDTNQQVVDAAVDINRLTESVARLNIQIVQTEGGSTSGSKASGLRDQRMLALKDLAAMIDIRAVEQADGSISVFNGGDFLVLNGQSRTVETTLTSNRGQATATIQIEGINSPLQTSSGMLGGLTTSRDQILGDFLDRLDDFAQALIFGFNQVHSSGQGLTGYEELSSEFAVSDSTEPLDAVSLPFTPVNGSFQVKVLNTQTGLTKTEDIAIHLNGLDDDTSLDDLAEALDAIDGITAHVTPSRKLEIATNSANVQFAFADDSSGVLAALGLGTFFSGTSALDIAVKDNLLNDPSKFAASKSGIGKDSDNTVALAGFLDQPLSNHGDVSITELYDRLTSEVTQASAVSQAVADGFRVFEQTLNGEELSISGVSLDEEAVRMIAFQRAFQASARMISSVSELLDLLVSL